MYLILILRFGVGEHSRVKYTESQNYSVSIGKTISTTTMGAYVLYSYRKSGKITKMMSI